MRATFRWCVALGLLATVPALSRPVACDERDQGEILAVIVNPANNSPDPSFEELQLILRMERQFWKDGRRVVLILPAGGSAEKDLLLEKVYHTTDAELRHDWARRLFAGEIPAVPSTLRTSEALVAAVKRAPGAIAVVPAASVGQGVRILAVGGKRPGEQGYPLSKGGC